MSTTTLTIAKSELLVRDERSDICCDLSRLIERGDEGLVFNPAQANFVAQAQARLEALVVAERQMVELDLENAEATVDGPDLLLGDSVDGPLVGDADCDRLTHRMDSESCRFEDSLEIEFMTTRFAQVGEEPTGEELEMSLAFDEAVETLNTPLQQGTLSGLGFGNNPFAAFLTANVGGFSTANALTSAAS